jgi:hypothetical protein
MRISYDDKVTNTQGQRSEYSMEMMASNSVKLVNRFKESLEKKLKGSPLPNTVESVRDMLAESRSSVLSGANFNLHGNITLDINGNQYEANLTPTDIQVQVVSPSLQDAFTINESLDDHIQIPRKDKILLSCKCNLKGAGASDFKKSLFKEVLSRENSINSLENDDISDTMDRLLKKYPNQGPHPIKGQIAVTINRRQINPLAPKEEFTFYFSAGRRTNSAHSSIWSMSNTGS